MIPCSGIYHPERVLPIDATFTVFSVDIASGEISSKTSFTGSQSASVIYMSQNAIYITYPLYESEFRIMLQFIKEEFADTLPASIIEKIVKLDSYDISSSSKMAEYQTILQNYYNALNDDDRLKVENEMQNRMADYRKSRKRNFDKTVIAKISLSDLEFVASGEVPGQPLNQFSLDEFNGNLRIATTIGNSWFSRSETANDVYVLGSDLKILGSVRDLGLTEKIYSARFIEDKGYVVTFRQTDPFYVLDLSNPQNPILAGELKIPGYSAYLHPLEKNKILGIGKEGSSVKISYFNVTDSKNPVEMDKYILKESWTDILNTHHAFLADAKYQIFFLPGSQGGYVFSYKNDKISLVKAVSEINAKRALYINNYLYIAGDNKISVLDQDTWEKIIDFEFF
jgi:uncharacterized secreted protein with C-terminal beta-propeller domain